jgi:hypothetical protein
MSNERGDAALNALESALGSLTPRPVALDRDALMYRAGRSSIRRWQLATGVAIALATALAVLLIVRPPVVRIVYVPAPPAPVQEAAPPLPPDTEPSADESPKSPYFRLQEQLLSRGLDGLPPLAFGPTKPVTTEELLSGM